ncbi:hypothetical protein [Kitasatospora sp. NPDC088548]|uniref:hypothetical protein n=1 Tax=Kitasatospora sp. NPDC088548 TaxID=3364075 RepID=UPI0038039B5C
MTWPELYLLHLASQAEPSPPPPPQQTAARARYQAEEDERQRAAAAAQQREEEEWQALATALREATGTRFEVRHNYTSHRHLDGYTQGGDHIYLLDTLHVGRIRRGADRPLCWVPSRAADPEVFDHLDDGRLPTCRACLRLARRLAGTTPADR